MLKSKAITRTTTRPLTPRQRYAHLRANERRALENYVDRLRGRFSDRVQHVILFGSRARLRGNGESDLDVLVVIDREDRQLENDVALEAFEPSLEHGAWISPLVWHQSHYELHRRLRMLIYRNIERDGIELWTWKTNAPSSDIVSRSRKTS
jgi:uncharacterized protein